MSGPLNVVIMGETGVGKSSVVNLIAGKAFARVSPDSDPCTENTTEYSTSTGLNPVHIWEIAGFNQPENVITKDDLPDADLGPVLADTTAVVDLVLFCMRGKKLTKTTKRIFEFVKNMFGNQVPIILVITHLEMEGDGMESWWVRNEAYLAREGVVGTGHVCVTGLREEKWKAKRDESRDVLLRVLNNHYSARRSRPLETCFLGYLRHMGKFNQKGRKLEKVLIKRYKLDARTARRLASSA